MATTVRDALEASLARIDDPQSDGRVTYTKLYAERARAEADAADARAKSGVKLSPLDGWVISIKDLFDVAGEVTTAGSSILRSQPAAKVDAPTIARLRQAGCVIVGKTNMSEFAFSGIGINRITARRGTPLTRAACPAARPRAPASRWPRGPPAWALAPTRAARSAFPRR